MNLGATNLLVMRHAESLEDIDKTAYERIADDDMPLSAKGEKQAIAFGSSLVEALGQKDCLLRIFLSPSKRVLRTACLAISQLPPSIRYEFITEPLIVKQNWGAVTTKNRVAIERERYMVGVLRYQFSGGESGHEMLERFKIFAQKLSRNMRESGTITLTIVITHGFEMRVLLKTLLGWTEEYFESLAHPHHCEMKRLSVHGEKYQLLDEMRMNDPSRNPNFIRRQTS